MTWKEYDLARYCRCLDELNETEDECYTGVNPDDTPKKVEKQDYYYRNGIQVKDVINQVYQFFGEDLSSWEAACIYNILKYLMRYKYKENPKQDLDKLIVNIKWLKEADI